MRSVTPQNRAGGASGEPRHRRFNPILSPSEERERALAGGLAQQRRDGSQECKEAKHT